MQIIVLNLYPLVTNYYLLGFVHMLIGFIVPGTSMTGFTIGKYFLDKFWPFEIW